jgi:hypothetical protein
MSAIQQMLLAGDGRPPFTGQVSYTTSTITTWTCPIGVHSVCVVAIGPGSTGTESSNRKRGGSGGGLGYKNDIPVVPGQSYLVVVGAANTTSSTYFINETTVCGRAGVAGGAGGTFVGDGGGNGGGGGAGSAGFVVGDGTMYTGGGGGSSGSYDGNGGAGGPGDTGSSGIPGGVGGQGIRGGVGGSGGSRGGGGGGGANLYGGVLPRTSSPFSVGNTGALYGSGGGAGLKVVGGSSAANHASASGRVGALRIIWGDGRAFPSTKVEDI